MRHRVSEVNHLLRCCRACKLLALRPSPLQEGRAGALNFVSDHFQCSSLVLEQLREPPEIGVERQPNAGSIFSHFLFLIPIRELAGSPTAAEEMCAAKAAAALSNLIGSIYAMRCQRRQLAMLWLMIHAVILHRSIFGGGVDDVRSTISHAGDKFPPKH
jgi:hypothetical protein